MPKISSALPAFALVLSTAAAGAQQTGSDGRPLGGMAPLYVHAPRSAQRVASATLTLPIVPSNKSWYANWIMLAGESPGTGHQLFAQVGMIRRPKADPRLHLFVAWQGTDPSLIEYRQYGHLAEGIHRFSIAQNGESIALFADDREVARLRLPPLARAPRAYFEIGPEVEAEGDALAGSIVHAAWRTSAGWDAASDRWLCRYENHGVFLRYEHGYWKAHGRFNRALPSGYDGACEEI